MVNKEYFDKFIDTLVEFHKFFSTEERDSCIPRQMRICILPNVQINLKVTNATLQFQLRNPQYTHIVANDGSNGGIFLYTKFDCFHCVLPLDDSNHYFDQFNCFQERLDGNYSLRCAMQLFRSALLQHAINTVSESVQITAEFKKSAKMIIVNAESDIKVTKMFSDGSQNVEMEVSVSSVLLQHSRYQLIEQAKVYFVSTTHQNWK